MQIKSTEAKFARRRFDGVARRMFNEVTSNTRRFPSIPKRLKRKFITMTDMDEARFGETEGYIVVFSCSVLFGNMICRSLVTGYTWKVENKKNMKKWPYDCC